MTSALEALAAAIPGKGYTTALTTGTGRKPHLVVASRAAPGLDAGVYAEGGWYWWGWSERIAPITDPAAAAALVAGMLRASAASRM